MLKKCLATLLLVGSGLFTPSQAGSDIEFMKRRFPNRAIYMPYALATSHTYSSDSFFEDYPRLSAQAEQNLALYQQRLGQTLHIDSLWQLVYSLPVDEIKAFPKGKLPAHLQALQGDKELLRYLVIAKEVEALKTSNDVWSYEPKSEQELNHQRDGLLKQIMSYKKGSLLDRYTLLACRLLTAQGKYPEVLRLWAERSPSLADNVIKEMIAGYVASAWYNTGKIQEAKEFYLSIADLESLLYIYRIENKQPVLSSIDQLRIGLQWITEHPNYVRILTRLLNYTEAYDLAIYRLGQEALKKNPSSALWNYTMAFIYERHRYQSSFDSNFAEEYFAKAVSASQKVSPRLGAEISEHLQKAITLLSFHRNASKGVTDDSALTWFRKEMTHALRAIKQDDGEFDYYVHRTGLPAVLETELSSYLNSKSDEYHDDEYHDSDNLHKLNITSNMLTSLYIDILGYDKSKWNPYYSTDFFIHFFSQASNDEAEKYVQTYVGHKDGYNDANYLYDALGTKYLASGDYDKAVEYLSKVTPRYIEQMNIRPFIQYDPFAKRARLNHQSAEQYKLNFAREMQRLKGQMYLGRDENTRAEAMLRFAQGLENAHTTCWMLTRYSDGMPYLQLPYPGESHDAERTSSQKAEYLRSIALKLFSDRERQAKAYWSEGYYKTVAMRFQGTEQAQYARTHCDKLKHYFSL